MHCTIRDIDPLDIQTIQVSFGSYSYGVKVRGKGFPLVCFHGFSESHRTWEHISLEGYRMITIDWIGHGISSRPHDPAPYHYERMLHDVHMILHSLAGERYALLGYSMGARLALAYSLCYGCEVTQLILESGSVGLLGEAQQERALADERLAQSIAQQDGTAFATRWGQLPIFTSQQQLSRQQQETLFQRRSENDVEALALTLRGSGQGVMPYVGDRLCELTMPVCYISGSLDEKYTKIGETYFPESHHTISGAGHTTHLEKPCEFMEILRGFLGGSHE